MKLKLLFWNIWTENQIRDPERIHHLKNSLSAIIDKHAPDVICLNEVVKSDNNCSIIGYLYSRGYKINFYCEIGPISKTEVTGSLIASRIPILNFERINIGNNITAKNKGYGNHKTALIEAKISLDKSRNIEIYLVHPINIKPSTLLEHRSQINEIKKRLRVSSNAIQIFGGDFNEPRYYPKSFRSSTRKLLSYSTGGFLRPTWTFKASRQNLINANLDKVFWTKSKYIQLQSFNVLDISISDHKPIIASFKIK